MRVRRVAAAVLISAILLVGALGSAAAAPNENACWGQVNKELARSGSIDNRIDHQESPRAGARNVARSLHDGGIIDDDSMQALGAFQADSLGLELDACD